MEEDEIKNFEEAIGHLAPWIKEKIGESKDRTVVVIDTNFLGDIDSRLVDKARKEPLSLYNQTRDILSKEGIWVVFGSTIRNDNVYIMRLLSDKKEFLMKQIQEVDVELNKLRDHIQITSADQLPDDVLEYLTD